MGGILATSADPALLGSMPYAMRIGSIASSQPAFVGFPAGFEGAGSGGGMPGVRMFSVDQSPGLALPPGEAGR
jgi:hypothetical protein